MATASGGRLDEDPNFSSINAYRDCDNALQCAPVNDSRSNLLTNVLNVEESVQNCTLLQLFTSEGVSTSYDNNVYDLPNSQLPIIENESLSNAEYINLSDSQLQNLPKEKKFMLINYLNFLMMMRTKSCGIETLFTPGQKPSPTALLADL